MALGFNPEATLRENIFLRGAAMGAPMHTILQLGRLDPGVRRTRRARGTTPATLSAGQRMRLGFAISTSVQPDIMLLDEWIGTGDAQFIKRARERMQDRVSGSASWCSPATATTWCGACAIAGSCSKAAAWCSMARSSRRSTTIAT